MRLLLTGAHEAARTAFAVSIFARAKGVNGAPGGWLWRVAALPPLLHPLPTPSLIMDKELGNLIKVDRFG